MTTDKQRSRRMKHMLPDEVGYHFPPEWDLIVSSPEWDLVVSMLGCWSKSCPHTQWFWASQSRDQSGNVCLKISKSSCKYLNVLANIQILANIQMFAFTSPTNLYMCCNIWAWLSNDTDLSLFESWITFVGPTTVWPYLRIQMVERQTRTNNIAVPLFQQWKGGRQCYKIMDHVW